MPEVPGSFLCSAVSFFLPFSGLVKCQENRLYIFCLLLYMILSLRHFYRAVLLASSSWSWRYYLLFIIGRAGGSVEWSDKKLPELIFFFSLVDNTFDWSWLLPPPFLFLYWLFVIISVDRLSVTRRGRRNHALHDHQLDESNQSVTISAQYTSCHPLPTNAPNCVLFHCVWSI